MASSQALGCLGRMRCTQEVSVRRVESKKAEWGPLGDRGCQETDSQQQVLPRQTPVEPAITATSSH